MCVDVFFVGSTAGGEDDDEYKASGSDTHNYYTLAHTVKETVTEQTSNLVNGELKVYQVSSSSFFCSR